jgi:hypothetical protein
MQNISLSTYVEKETGTLLLAPQTCSSGIDVLSTNFDSIRTLLLGSPNAVIVSSPINILIALWNTVPFEFQLNLVFNVLSLVLFLLFRRHGFFQHCYNFFKYAWIAQFAVLFLPHNAWDTRIQMTIAYGFFFDYFLLQKTSTATDKDSNQVPTSTLVLRFCTNLVHHMTLFVATTQVEKLAYAVCWTAHLFPWFRLLGERTDWLKISLLAGNFTPVLALVWLLVVDHESAQYVTFHGWAVLSQMIIYRGVYINASYKVFSTFGICSKETETDTVLVWGRRVLYVVTILATGCLAVQN